MTRIERNMGIVNINGRKQFFGCDHIEIKEKSSGRWVVRVWHGDIEDGPSNTFDVVGGRKSGGAAHEWFCHCPFYYGEQYVPTNSMVRAIKMGVTC